MRRQLAAAIVLVVAGASMASAANDFPYGNSLAFTVYRNGKEVGQHRVFFNTEGSRRTVTVEVDLSVKALGVTAYRYVHKAREVWNNNTLQSLEARTDDNGKKYTVRVQRRSDGLEVEREVVSQLLPAAANEGGGWNFPEVGREVVPANMLPTSNWNFGQVGESVLLNTQYGTPSHTKITAMGREPVKTASGATVEATRYHYTGELRMDQWFDDRGRWVRAAFPAFDGSTIEYVLQE
jgi:hypothetical protein